MKKILLLITLSFFSLTIANANTFSCNSQIVKKTVEERYKRAVINRVENSAGGFKIYSGTRTKSKEDFIKQISIMKYEVKRISQIQNNGSSIICSAELITSYDGQIGVGLPIRYKVERYLDDGPNDPPTVSTSNFGTDDTYRILSAVKGKGL